MRKRATRMRRKKTRKEEKIGVSLVGALLVIIGISPFAFPQAQPPVVRQPGTNATKSIVGTVLDAHGAPVPRAIVLLKDMKTLQIRSYIAQEDGTYHFYDLNGDINYLLRAQAGGLTSPQKSVTVFNGHRVVKLNLKLTKKLKT
jgi:hypothetical protein